MPIAKFTAKGNEHPNKMVTETHEPSVLFGGFNLPSIDWVQHTATEARLAQFLDAYEDANQEQLDMFPTRVGGNILDLVLTNVLHRVMEVEDLGRQTRDQRPLYDPV
jgi:hypothetical protein